MPLGAATVREALCELGGSLKPNRITEDYCADSKGRGRSLRAHPDRSRAIAMGSSTSLAVHPQVIEIIRNFYREIFYSPEGFCYTPSIHPNTNGLPGRIFGTLFAVPPQLFAELAR